jgi:DNA-directed RNA polymerase specialized sigma24 family protein
MTQTSPAGFIRTEDQVHLDTEALRLRSKGLTYQKVADLIGTSKQTAYNRVQRALAAIPKEAVDEYRKLENERLDELLELVLKKAHDPENKAAMFAVDRALAIFERKGKLNGTDSPVKTVTVTVDALDMEIARLSAELGVDGHELESRILSEISNSGNAETDGAGEAS